jgi:glycosyltransferase involved in cell wall biosynthesis
MKVLQIVPTYLPATRYGGPIQSVHGLSRALVNAGVEVEVFTTNVDGAGVSPVPVDAAVDLDGVKVHYFPVTSPRRLYRSPAMARALEQRVAEFDVVHLHSVFLWPTLTAARLAKRNHIPYLIAPRGMLDSAAIRMRGWFRKKLWIAVFEKRVLRNADAIHVTSQLEAQALHTLGLGVAPLVNVPNGVWGDWTGVQPVAELAYDRAKRIGNPVLFVGRLSHKKGLDQLVIALGQLPGVHLNIAGPDEHDYAQSLWRLARRNGVTDRIRFLGLVNENERNELMRNASLLVLPSRSENFANVVAEAMLNGCPVLVSPHVGIASDAVAAGAAALTEVDADAIATAISELLSAPEQLASMGRAGAELVRDRYGWASIAHDMIAAYERAMRHPAN